MIVIRPMRGVPGLNARVNRLKAALQPPAITPVLERVAQETFAHIVPATPKKWTGQVRRSWRVLRPSAVLRYVSNDNKIMRWLEFGTANGGTGYIYPRRKKVLFIPKTKKASYGWKPGMKFGVDFILAARVRGIRPRGIVAAETGLARIRLQTAMRAHVEKALG
jgi:hypothetical protein